MNCTLNTIGIALGCAIFMFTACEAPTPEVSQSTRFRQANELMKKDKFKRDHPTADYRNLPNSKYILPVEMCAIKDREKNVEAQVKFFNSAIPYGEIKLLEWENKMTWQKANLIYRAFIKKNKNNPYIDPFREHGSYEILVRFNLLADTTIEGFNTIHYYLQQLITAKSFNTVLIYYCIKTIAGHFPEKDLKKLQERPQRILIPTGD